MKKSMWFAMAFAIALAATFVAAPADASVETECVSWEIEGGVDGNGKTPRKFNLGRKAIFPENPRPDGAEVRVTATRYRDGKPLNRGKLVASRVDAFERLEDALQYQLDGGGGGAVFSQTVKFFKDSASFGRLMNGGKKFVVFIFDLTLKNQPPLGIGERIAVEACVTPVDLKSCDYVLAEPVCTEDELMAIAKSRVEQYPGLPVFTTDPRCTFEPPRLRGGSFLTDYFLEAECLGRSTTATLGAISISDGVLFMSTREADFGRFEAEYLRLQEFLLDQAGE